MSNGLIENTGVRQRPEEGFRRWFLNRYFDLIFWYTQEGGDLTGFQFCYGKPFEERAYTCGETFSSHRFVGTDDPGQGESMMQTAILKGDAGFIEEDVIERFIEEAGELSSDLKTLVIEKLKEFNERVRESSSSIP